MARSEKQFTCIICNKLFTTRNWKENQIPQYCSEECRYPKKIRICPICGKQEEVSATNKKVLKCCSIQCGNIWKNKNNNDIVKCDSCGVEFQKPNSQIKDKNYCSNKCRFSSYEDAWLTKTCITCGKEFETRRCVDSRYCSNDCNLRSEERKENNKRLYTGVSLLNRGYSQKQYNTFIQNTIDRNKKNIGLTYEEIYGEEQAKKIKEEMSKNRTGSNNSMSYESLMKRLEIDSYEEAREMMPTTGRFGELHPFYGKHHTVESKKQMIDTMKQRGMFGRSSNGLYNNIPFQGTWELKYIIDCIESNIPIKRYDLEPIEYIFEDKILHYFPDFIINEKTIIEIKGNLWDKKKIEAKKNAAEKLFKYCLITDVGQTQNPRTFLRLAKEKYGDKLVIKHHPYGE